MGKKKGKESDALPKEEFDAVELITKRPQTVVLVLQSQEEAVLQTVCEALYKFADKSPENKLQLLNYGALEYLIKLISHDDKLIKRNAIMCLGTVASEESARRVMRKLGCIPPMLMLLLPEEELVCHEFSTMALSYLAEDYTSKTEIFEKQGLPLLINHVLSPDCDVQRNSVKAIGLMLEDFQSRAAFKELNGVEPLLKQLDSEYPAIQDLALIALIKCVQDVDNRDSMRDLEGLVKLVDIIGNESMSDLHIQCLRCLAVCLEDTISLKHIQSTGLFQKLLSFITEANNPEIQQYAASVIAASCRIDENRRIFNEQEVEKTLIILLSCDQPSVAIAAVGALAEMAENLSSREKIGKLDGIPLIIPLLKNDNPEAKETATLALANLTNSNQSNCAVIMEKNTIDILIKLLSDQSSEVQSNCAVTLSNLTLNETWRTEIEKHGVIKGLVNAMNSSDPKVQVHACEALTAFVYDYDSRMQVLSENGIPNLIELVKSNYETVRRNASWVIALCAVDVTLAEEVTRCGGLPILQEINLSSRKSKFTEVALDRVLNSNLSAKYATTGTLTCDNIINDMFYDAGKVGSDQKFKTLVELSIQQVDQNRPVILINFKQMNKQISKQSSNNSQKSKMVPEKSVERSKIKSKQERRLSKQKDSHEDSIKSDENPQQSSDEQANRNIFHEPIDEEFLTYINEIQSDISSLMTTELQIRTLACYVCEKMGGIINRSEVSRFSYELHISELKTECNSNIIPIGKIKQGIYYHRALLFKALADALCLPCSLVRGDYGRAWNEVQLCGINENGQAILPPKMFIVDLMHQPGELLLSGSPEAVIYQRI